jgi:hypothetical protein
VTKRVREFVQRLEPAGWRYAGTTGGDHSVIEHPQFGRYVFPATASDWRSEMNSLVGLSRPELEERLSGQRRGVQPTEVRRARRRSRRPGAQRSWYQPQDVGPVEVREPSYSMPSCRTLEHVQAAIDRFTCERSKLRLAGTPDPADIALLDGFVEELFARKRKMQARLAA